MNLEEFKAECEATAKTLSIEELLFGFAVNHAQEREPGVERWEKAKVEAKVFGEEIKSRCSK